MAVGERTEHGRVVFEARGRMDGTGKWSMLAVGLGCLLAVPYAFARNPEGSPTENLLIIGATYVIVLVTVVLSIVHLNSRIKVTETHVIKQRFPRRALVVRRSDIAEAVVTRHYAVARFGGPRAFLLDRDGETLLHSHPVRDPAEVEGLAQVAPHVTHVAVLRPEEATQRWPRMLPWSHANPKAGVLLGGGIVLGVVVIGVLAAVIFA